MAITAKVDQSKTAWLKTKYKRVKRIVDSFLRKNRQTVRIAGIGLGILGIVLIIYPFVPALVYQVNPPDDSEVPYQVQNPQVLGVRSQTGEIPEDNRLVIPSIGVDAKILEGDSIDILAREEGVWHEPNTHNPTIQGNMVISGHRFQYRPPNMVTFYHLDKVKTGDYIIVYWEGQEYDYQVQEVFTVEPTQVEIRDPIEGKTEITLYTCTPLWNNTHRLVVKAEQVNQ